MFDGFNQFKLSSATVKVVTIAMDLEVSIAHEEIRQKAEADLKRYELARTSKLLFFRRREKSSRR